MAQAGTVPKGLHRCISPKITSSQRGYSDLSGGPDASAWEPLLTDVLRRGASLRARRLLCSAAMLAVPAALRHLGIKHTGLAI